MALVLDPLAAAWIFFQRNFSTNLTNGTIHPPKSFRKMDLMSGMFLHQTLIWHWVGLAWFLPALAWLGLAKLRLGLAWRGLAWGWG